MTVQSSASLQAGAIAPTLTLGATRRAGPADVLLVEDDDGDVLMTQVVFEERQIADHLHVVGNGETALEFLRRADRYAEAPRPGLILLDLNLPGRGGLEILADIKADPDLAAIPVVILTSSQAPDDIVRAYSLHASAYITKPIDFEHYLETIRAIGDFFCVLAELPV